ncbi:hypothetical protein ACOI91_11545 [Corynebacterium striatum]|uniref:hypothetical protein n=2 Tax=Corynebacterium striatum TaxID=43770 RepID=UPI003B5AB763
MAGKSHAVSTMTTYSLAPGVAVVEREPGVIQFGMDATRVGVVEVEMQIVKALNLLSKPMTRESVERLLVRAGMDDAAARTLIEDLICYNILWPEQPRQSVVVLGSSALAQTLRTVFHNAGFILRNPLESENMYSYIASVSEHFPVVAADMLHEPVNLAAALSKCKGTFLPVSLVDSRGVIGPVHVDGRGPCPMCTHLHRIDVDGQWHQVVSQLADADRNTDDLVAQAVAVQSAVLVRRLAGWPSPPGAKSSRVMPGEQLEVDLYGHNQYRLVIEHPKCPYCFETKRNR